MLDKVEDFEFEIDQLYQLFADDPEGKGIVRAAPPSHHFQCTLTAVSHRTRRLKICRR